MESNALYLVYHGLFLPKVAHSENSLNYFETFVVQDDDIFIISYPKSEYTVVTHLEPSLYLYGHFFSGTTWMQEIIPLLLNGGDLTPVQTIPNWDRVPWLEETRAAVVMDKLSSPRAIVSHMPYHLMPSTFFSSKAKVVYIARNPKDVLVSSFHYHRMASFLDDPGTFEEFINKFQTGQVLFGKWTDHVKSWKNPDLGDRILYITYEELVQDLRGGIERILCFLGRQLSEDALDRVIEHCQFKNMKHNKMSNYSLVPQEIMDSSKSPFLRKGRQKKK
ncbi:hypothetical protein P4O66_005214 [Electrophorus voltai]|uniref:Sulfotransferase n=1 Tax=Electrophorus voltai TaxID=2609070 RepID=A0AAD8ZWR7_9TELE|nr:hypothetical protein P4O66_005214 [Electrophorus voltai]